MVWCASIKHKTKKNILGWFLLTPLANLDVTFGAGFCTFDYAALSSVESTVQR
jgi:hypothetical protein